MSIQLHKYCCSQLNCFVHTAEKLSTNDAFSPIGYEGLRIVLVNDFGVQCVLKIDTRNTTTFVDPVTPAPKLSQA